MQFGPFSDFHPNWIPPTYASEILWILRSWASLGFGVSHTHKHSQPSHENQASHQWSWHLAKQPQKGTAKYSYTIDVMAMEEKHQISAP